MLNAREAGEIRRVVYLRSRRSAHDRAFVNAAVLVLTNPIRRRRRHRPVNYLGFARFPMTNPPSARYSTQ